MGLSATSVIMITVAFLCFAFIMPIALNALAGNNTVNASVPSVVKTIAITVASLVVCLGILIRFMPRGK